ncbi:MAG: hypothetical protein S4CHLAM7_07220 [Chlamydiae bacterium]|nr:hypothetical protein [Chlamydiota bacterium]
MLKYNKVTKFAVLFGIFLKRVFFLLKSILAFIWLIVIKIRVWLAKHNWRLSRNFNHYNPTLGATVYKNGGNWNIACQHVHYNGYKTKKIAKQAALEMWLENKQYL